MVNINRTQFLAKLHAWFWGIRPFSLSASIAPILVGTSLATTVTTINLPLFFLCITGSIAIQIGTNLTDEYADHRSTGGSDKFLAPHKVIQRGLLSERNVLNGMIVVFTYGIITGLIITYYAGFPILLIGLVSVLVAYLYAGGPKPLGHIGLGEIIVFIFMGPVMVMSAYFVQVQSISVHSFLVSIPVGCIVTAILHCNNMRDVDEDSKAGKISIAILLGSNFSKFVYSMFIVTAYLVIGALALSELGYWISLGLVTIPIGIQSIVKVFRGNDKASMNKLMVISAKLHAWTGYALSLGILLTGL
ncbi:MAG: 1,4-dihydroxy-2-naphthoate octaprenyltransferase [Dehalococcoidia bacterium]|nr:1,4-dihydroxy-2-naphthoate octaprenyltransferase [Dehalococcoidia bacterium]